jgi:hypothetical protein
LIGFDLIELIFLQCHKSITNQADLANLADLQILKIQQSRRSANSANQTKSTNQINQTHLIHHLDATLGNANALNSLSRQAMAWFLTNEMTRSSLPTSAVAWPVAAKIEQAGHTGSH